MKGQKGLDEAFNATTPQAPSRREFKNNGVTEVSRVSNNGVTEVSRVME